MFRGPNSAGPPFSVSCADPRAFLLEPVPFLRLTDDRAAPFLARLPEGERFKTWHVVCPHRTLRSRRADGIAVLR
jgi:hypothetical protein